MALRDEIIARFPLGYARYIEVFGGAAWVLFRKQPESFEVYNDFNSNLVNLFRVVKSEPEALIEELDWTLNSRVDFEELKAMFANKAEMGDVERAANFFRLIKLSYGSKCDNFGGNPVVLERRFPAIRNAHRRLAQGVIIENKDFEALIRQYDRADAFFYLDPPYFGTEDYYHDVGFTKDDHLRLFDALSGITGKFLLSYNDDPFIRGLYKGYPTEATTRLSSLAQCYEGGAQYPEVFIANYDMEERSRQNEQLSIIL